MMITLRNNLHDQCCHNRKKIFKISEKIHQNRTFNKITDKFKIDGRDGGKLIKVTAKNSEIFRLN